jgi:acetoin utilization protein AcuB
MEIKKRMLKKISVLGPEEPLSRAFELLVECDLKLLPVVDNDSVVGIISYRDIAHYLMNTNKHAQTLQNENETPIRLVMTKDVKTISPHTEFLEAAELMSAHKISGLPVVDKGVLVGFVTETTILEEFIDVAK